MYPENAAISGWHTTTFGWGMPDFGSFFFRMVRLTHPGAPWALAGGGPESIGNPGGIGIDLSSGESCLNSAANGGMFKEYFRSVSRRIIEKKLP